MLENPKITGLQQLKRRYSIFRKAFWVVMMLSIAPFLLLLSSFVIKEAFVFNNLQPTFYSSFWTTISVAIALLTTMLAYADFKIRKNVAIIIYGTATVVSAVLEINYLLHVNNGNTISPFVETSFIWGFNFLFFAISLLFGTLIFIKVKVKTLRTPSLKNAIIMRTLITELILGLLILIACKAIPSNFQSTQKLTQYLTVCSLIVVLCWGLGYSRILSLKLPNVFLKFLGLGVIPLALSQILFLVSKTPFDIYFNAANYLKCLGYFIPFTGIIINYIDTLVNEQKIIAKLDIEIKERQNLTNYLIEREALLTNAEKISKLGSWVFDLKQQTTTWSNQLYQLYGFNETSFTPSEGILKTVISPETWDKFQKEINSAVVNKTNFAVEYQIKLPNGTSRFMLGQGYFSTKDEKLLGTVQDITELKEATLKLQRNETLLREGEAVSNNGSWEWISGKKIIFWSDEMFNIHGHLPHSMFVTLYSYLKFVHPEDIKPLKTAFIEALREKKPFRISYRIIRPKGDIRHLTTTGKYKQYNVGSHSFLGNTQDVTILKEAERKLEEKINELNSSNKDLEQFAYVASHDLQEPLRKIRAFGDRLTSKYASLLSAEGQDYIERMQNAAERMQTLIDDLLAFSRVTRQPRTFEKIVLKEALQRVLTYLDHLVEEKKATINLLVDETIEGIESQLFQVFQNLLSNSLKFTNPNKNPVINITTQNLLGNKLPVSGAIPNQTYCVINISDNGIGFDEAYADKIFDLFQRLHARTEYKGTGIGLAICKKIVENHSGFIFAKSIEGEGSSFFIALPINHA